VQSRDANNRGSPALGSLPRAAQVVRAQADGVGRLSNPVDEARSDERSLLPPTTCLSRQPRRSLGRLTGPGKLMGRPGIQ
jgi:hypothetical protein